MIAPCGGTARQSRCQRMESISCVSKRGVDTFCNAMIINNKRLLVTIGNVPPAEAEERYYAMLDEQSMAAQLTPNSLRQSQSGSICLEVSSIYASGHIQCRLRAGRRTSPLISTRRANKNACHFQGILQAISHFLLNATRENECRRHAACALHAASSSLSTKDR